MIMSIASPGSGVGWSPAASGWVASSSVGAGDQPTPEPGDAIDMIIETVRSRDAGEGVEYNDLVTALVHAGHSRESAEDAIDHARDQGEVMEPRFGFFQLVPE